MGKAERMTVTLMGGAPWGFRLIGGGALPLTINKIRKKSMAHNLGLKQGDAVLSINGVPVHDKTQDEAIDMMDKSGRSLKLEIFRHESEDIETDDILMEGDEGGDFSEINSIIEEKPKKPIWAQSQTQQTVTTEEDGSTTITTKTTSETTTEVIEQAVPSEMLIISADGGVSSEAFQNAVDQASQGLQLSFSGGEVTSSSFEQNSSMGTSDGLQLSFNAGDVSSSSYQQEPVSVEQEGLQLSFTQGDTSSSTFEQQGGDNHEVQMFVTGDVSTNAAEESYGGQSEGLVIAPATIELESTPMESSQTLLEDSGIQLDIQATSDVADAGRILPIQLEEDVKQPVVDLHVESESQATMATPFVEVQESTTVIEEPLSYSNPPPKIITPEPVKIPTPQLPKSPSPQPPPQIYSPTPEPVVQLQQPSPVQPSNTVVTTSQESFDDGQTKREVRQEQHVTTSEDGLRTSMVSQESSSTVTTKEIPGFMQSQESAFSSFQPEVQRTQIQTTIGVAEPEPQPEPVREVSSFSMHSMQSSAPSAVSPAPNYTSQYHPVQAPKPKYQAPQQTQPKYQPVAQPTYQAPKVQQPVYQPAPPQQPVYQPAPPQQPVYQPAPPQQPTYQPVQPTPPKPQPKPQPQYATLPHPTRPQPPTTISTSFSSNSLDRRTPCFRPSKFVPGFSNRDIPGLYSPMSPKIEIDLSMQTDLYGKENINPQPIQPMFQVRNFVAAKPKQTFKPNMWLPGEKPASRQPSRPHTPSESTVTYMEEQGFRKDFETFPVPKMKKENRLTIKERKDALMHQPMHINRIEDFKAYLEHEDEGDDGYEEEVYYEDQSPSRFERTHLFAPPVMIQARVDGEPVQSPGAPEDEYYLEEVASSQASPSSSLKKKAQYADSAFYSTPGKHLYPTIDEQMKLCRAISTSLTSAANKRARGAKMFLRRRKKANKWVHEGEPGWSSAGDVAELHELDSELQAEDGGSKPLFYFKIPNLKGRVQAEEQAPKMSLSQDQFERLRLTAKKCDHRNIAPEISFDIAADLKHHKGRGGRLFEKRRARSDKFVIDQSHLADHPQVQLENVLTQPIPQKETPWEAAAHHAGNVEPAFEHLSQMEENQKMNAYMKISTPKQYSSVKPVLKSAPAHPALPVQPVPDMSPPMPAVRTDLRGDSATLVRGKDFNRSARGWMGGGEYPVADSLTHIEPPKASQQSDNFGNYNNKVRAWNAPGHSPYGSGSPAPVSPVRQPQQYSAPISPVRQPTVYSAPISPVRQAQQYSQPQPDYSNYRAAPEFQVHDPEIQELHGQGMTSSYSSAQFEAPPLHEPSRPRSRQPSGYGGSTGGSNYDIAYKQEYGYNYVPVDNKFGSGDYNSFNDVKPMYMQPIIPGTDL